MTTPNETGKTTSPWIIGLALFSMFFGSGNLIFPLAVGLFAQENYFAATLGFSITAVLVPFMGVIAMLMFHGNYRSFFGVYGKTVGFLLTFILLVSWVPIGSAPRCVTLSYGAVKHYIGGTPLWLFSLLYTGLIFVLTVRKSRVIDILGRVLTPCLLVALLVVFVKGILESQGLSPADHSPATAFQQGLGEGYNTQDLIAAFFFSSSVIALLTNREDKEQGGDDRPALKLALKSSIIGITILAIVYFGLLYLGAAHSSLLEGVSKDLLLPTLVRLLLGDQLGFIATIAIALACVTTSVALALVFADFLRVSIFRRQVSHSTALAITSVVTYIVSLQGFAGISAILGPVMQVLYPLLIAMIVCSCGYRAFRTFVKKKDSTQLMGHSLQAERVTF